MSARKIWALSSGEYSDYGVKALFPTRELAERALAADIADKESWSDPFIEEFDLWEDVPAPSAVCRVTEEWWDKGQAEGYNEHTVTALPWNHFWDIPRRPTVRFVRAPTHGGKGGRIEITAKTMTAARKVYSEQKAQWLAHPDRRHFRESEPKE